MKKLIPLILILFLANGYAQDPQLFVNDWYLQKLRIDQIDYTFPTPGHTSILTFSPTAFQIQNNNNCLDTSFQTDVTYVNDDKFVNGNTAGYLLLQCNDQMSQLFLNRQVEFYNSYDNFGNTINPFLYVINPMGQEFELIVTNIFGDEAIYNTSQLSSKSFSKNTFAIAPNPVNDILTFSGLDESESASISIYDVFAKRVLNNKSVDWKKNTIDLSKLESGIYFLKVQQENGDVMNKKIIKR